MKTLKTLDGAIYHSKDESSPIDEMVLEGLIGKTVYAKTNVLLDKDGNKHNVWFAGIMAGYQKSIVSFDYLNDKFLDEKKVQLHVLLTDGMAYSLSESELEIEELTEDAFLAMVAEYTANELSNEILLPEKKDKKIILPGRDF